MPLGGWDIAGWMLRRETTHRSSADNSFRLLYITCAVHLLNVVPVEGVSSAYDLKALNPSTFNKRNDLAKLPLFIDRISVRKASVECVHSYLTGRTHSMMSLPT